MYHLCSGYEHGYFFLVICKILWYRFYTLARYRHHVPGNVAKESTEPTLYFGLWFCHLRFPPLRSNTSLLAYMVMSVLSGLEASGIDSLLHQVYRMVFELSVQQSGARGRIRSCSQPHFLLPSRWTHTFPLWIECCLNKRV